MPARLTQTLGRYMRAAPLPLMTALGSVLLAWGLSRAALARAMDDATLLALFLGLWSLGCILAAFIAFADSLSRFREYQRIHSLIMRYGWQVRIMRPIAGSRCQRDAARLASAEAGCLAQTKQYLRMQGYRWYHIMPDRVVADPRHLFSKAFWRSVLVPAKNSHAPKGRSSTKPRPSSRKQGADRPSYGTPHRVRDYQVEIFDVFHSAQNW